MTEAEVPQEILESRLILRAVVHIYAFTAGASTLTYKMISTR